MGMYNEVYDDCPKCGDNGYMQISQVVLGFGDFRLPNLADLKRRYDEGDMTAAQITNLAAEVSADNAIFRCCADDCGHSWRADPAKVLAIQLLTYIDPYATKERALQLLRDAGII